MYLNLLSGFEGEEEFQERAKELMTLIKEKY